jgi:hypothetical protein
MRNGACALLPLLTACLHISAPATIDHCCTRLFDSAQVWFIVSDIESVLFNVGCTAVIEF